MGSHVCPDIRVQREDFDINDEIRRLAGGRKDIGAIVTFSGLCRDENGRLGALELEHYPGMAEKQLAKVAASALERWPLSAVTVLHRFGRISAGENIVLVITASPHRSAAFEAAEFVMDYLKTDAPFWKKEHPAGDETGRWVSARDEDEARRVSWQTKPKKK